MTEQQKDQNLQPSAIVAHIREYVAAAGVCIEHGHLLTGQILFALATEVLLKAAIEHTGGTYRKKHNLLQLFRQLPEDLQQKALDIFEKRAVEETLEGRDPRQAFLHVLNESKHNFIELRYAYETGPPPGEFTTHYDLSTTYFVLEKALRPVFGRLWYSGPVYSTPE